MKVQQLEYIVAVADYGSYARAAESLGVSRQMISRTVSDVECRLGITLFERKGNHMIVRSAAEEFIRRARELLVSHQEFRNDFGLGASDELGVRYQKTSISFALTALGCIFPGTKMVLRRLSDAMTGAYLNFEYMNSESVLEETARGRCDIGVIDSAPAMLAGLDCELLMPVQLAVWVADSGNYPARLTVNDLEGMPLITPGYYSHLRRLVARVCREQGVKPDIKAEVTVVANVWDMVRVYKGAYLAAMATVDERFGLTPIPLDIPDAEDFGFYAIKRKAPELRYPCNLVWRELINSRALLGESGEPAR